MLWIASVKRPFRTSVDALMKSAVNHNCHLADQMKIIQKLRTGGKPAKPRSLSRFCQTSVNEISVS